MVKFKIPPGLQVDTSHEVWKPEADGIDFTYQPVLPEQLKSPLDSPKAIQEFVLLVMDLSIKYTLLAFNDCFSRKVMRDQFEYKFRDAAAQMFIDDYEIDVDISPDHEDFLITIKFMVKSKPYVINIRANQEDGILIYNYQEL